MAIAMDFTHSCCTTSALAAGGAPFSLRCCSSPRREFSVVQVAAGFFSRSLIHGFPVLVPRMSKNDSHGAVCVRACVCSRVFILVCIYYYLVFFLCAILRRRPGKLMAYCNCFCKQSPWGGVFSFSIVGVCRLRRRQKTTSSSPFLLLQLSSSLSCTFIEDDDYDKRAKATNSVTGLGWRIFYFLSLDLFGWLSFFLPALFVVARLEL